MIRINIDIEAHRQDGMVSFNHLTTKETLSPTSDEEKISSYVLSKIESALDEIENITKAIPFSDDPVNFD